MKTAIKSLVAIFFLISIAMNAKAQVFRLDSVLYSQFKKDSLPKFVLQNENAKGRLPIFVSEDMIKLFRLRDTIIDGMQINYFTSASDMVKKYQLKQTGTNMSKISLRLMESSLNKILIDLTYSSFKCDKFTVKEGRILAEISGLYLIEYEARDATIPIKIMYNGEH